MSAAISLQSFHPLSSSNPHNKSKKNRPPLFISTNPSHLNLLHLRDLFFSTNLSCHRFPHLDSHGRVEPVDLDKLRTAVLHSSVVVSVFSRGEFCEGEGRKMEKSEFGIGELIKRAVPVSESNGTLVGFGRAVSDCGLTASIYDVAVIPSLQRLGIGQLIVKRIIRVLTSGGIYDIAALCSEKERLFFEACGFKEDLLGSTTMMYTQAAPSHVKDDLLVKRSGRMMLLVPPMRNPIVSYEMIPIDEKGNVEGVFKLSDQKNEIPLHREDGPHPSYQHRPYPLPASQPENRHYPPPAFPYANQAPFLGNYANPSTAGPSHHPTRTPPPPPPPSNVGFIPTFLPGTSELPPAHYINMPPNAAGAGTRQGVGPGFGMGVGAGALAAGAVIFGDDYMSGFDFPTGFQGGSLTITADPPF